MPQQPDEPFGTDVDIDDSHKYIAELVRIEEKPSMSQYKKSADETSLHHFWHLYDMEDGGAILDNASGEMFEWLTFTDSRTHHNKTTGQIADARELANVLLQRELTDQEVKDMIQEGWDTSLVGKRAVVDLEQYVNKAGYVRWRPLRWRAYTRPATTARRGRRLDDEED